MSTTATTTAVMANEVPLVAGDVLRSIDAPAVSPPIASPTLSNGARTGSPTNSIGKTKGHRRASSAASDLAKAIGIDLEAVSMAEARKVMSEEHKILGFRPPAGSFAAEVQSIAAKHPDGKPGASLPDTSKLKEIAREDALRILAERKSTNGAGADANADGGASAKTGGAEKPAVLPAKVSPPNPGVNLDKISASDARILMSHEHRALGFRPPPGSLAAEAQSAAARNPEGDGTHLDDDTLRAIALRDAERIKADREVNLVGEVNVSAVSKEAAATIASIEARALGHPPPSGSLAAEAQSAADKHPAGGSFDPAKDPEALAQVAEAAREEGERLREAEVEVPMKVDGAEEGANSKASAPSASTPEPAHAEQVEKTETQTQTEKMTSAPPHLVRGLATPPFSRSETGESVEIVGDVLA
ncbi:hypothetical protein C2E23DRAFT_901017 [Lenzites betulinus]|nr:hypothetical protein C2E23DRAFT_901017 [Lenzites betulinus]